MSFAARALLFAVRVYQAFFSALMPSACKFYPSCSHYAAEALRIHGARRGSWLALRRVLRCHPFTPGGVDLVPDAADFREAKSSDGLQPVRVLAPQSQNPWTIPLNPARARRIVLRSVRERAQGNVDGDALAAGGGAVSGGDRRLVADLQAAAGTSAKTPCSCRNHKFV